jgi:hypothetical protein
LVPPLQLVVSSFFIALSSKNRSVWVSDNINLLELTQNNHHNSNNFGQPTTTTTTTTTTFFGQTKTKDPLSLLLLIPS